MNMVIQLCWQQPVILKITFHILHDAFKYLHIPIKHCITIKYYSCVPNCTLYLDRNYLLQERRIKALDVESRVRSFKVHKWICV